LRLTMPEVAALAATGRIEETTHFPAQRTFVYRLESSDTVAEPEAAFSDSTLTIRVPRDTLRRWHNGSDVSIEARQSLAGGHTLRILIEKDFECLDRTDESQEGTYPHPARGGACGPTT